MYEYKAHVVKVYDGDTITAEIDLGFNVKVKETLRLYGINTPEIRGKERDQGLISRDRLRGLILGRDIYIRTFKDKKGKYGRYIADVYLEIDDEISVNKQLVNEGLAEFKDY